MSLEEKGGIKTQPFGVMYILVLSVLTAGKTSHITHASTITSWIVGDIENQQWKRDSQRKAALKTIDSIVDINEYFLK
ncbi:hypothetical protein Glove_139g280 [Diversispora epigaea]|uniref:Uncharacterized protein n=1 Tax=Diversispora epigaea TaxID=1348612 RepID=A0A397IZP0_9GLOM|nr:hypothetical protein Glove_139g280 [Diversispora epigaea]